jgi:hypothetical protein
MIPRVRACILVSLKTPETICLRALCTLMALMLCMYGICFPFLYVAHQYLSQSLSIYSHPVFVELCGRHVTFILQCCMTTQHGHACLYRSSPALPIISPLLFLSRKELILHNSLPFLSGPDLDLTDLLMHGAAASEDTSDWESASAEVSIRDSNRAGGQHKGVCQC